MRKSILITTVSLPLVLVTGCDTTTGALSGAGVGGVLGGLAARHNPLAGAVIGAAAGALVGGAIGHMNERERARLQAESPQTYYVVRYNNAVAMGQPLPPPPPGYVYAPPPGYVYAPPPGYVPPAPPPVYSAPSGQPATAPQSPAPTQPPPVTAPATPAPSAQPGPGANAPLPLKVDDIKAMTGAGIKPEAIIDAIKESRTTYTATDIDAAQKATPPVDPSVIAYMKKPTA